MLEDRINGLEILLDLIGCEFKQLDRPDIVYKFAKSLAKHEIDEEACFSLMEGKRRDYGRNSIEMFGHVGILVRMGDKVCRLLNLVQNRKIPVNESIQDSWTDLFNYAHLGQELCVD